MRELLVCNVRKCSNQGWTQMANQLANQLDDRQHQLHQVALQRLRGGVQPARQAAIVDVEYGRMQLAQIRQVRFVQVQFCDERFRRIDGRAGKSAGTSAEKDAEKRAGTSAEKKAELAGEDETVTDASACDRLPGRLEVGRHGYCVPQ